MSISQAVYEAQIQRIADLQARLTEAERDAARYRWLRKNAMLSHGGGRANPERLDALVDAAIKEGK